MENWERNTAPFVDKICFEQIWEPLLSVLNT